MTKSQIKSWYMDGMLTVFKHYVEAWDDYTDLFEKIEYYLLYSDVAEQIILNFGPTINN